MPLKDIPVIDVDTHIIEPYDLWTSRMASKWGDRIPYVKWDDGTQQESWFIDGLRVTGAAHEAMAGWHEYPPDRPTRLEDVARETWDASERLKMMDKYGIHAQILYPNVNLFNADRLIEANDFDFQLDIIRAYNDWLTDFSSIAPDRFIPISLLPFWDMEATIAELQRCAAMGHKGVIFTQEPRAFGLQALDDRYWDRLWAAAQEAELPVNFHVGTGDNAVLRMPGNPENGKHANYAAISASFFITNAKTMTQLICGGVCHRFPKLDFVAVESGIGWIPFYLDALDWQWQSSGVPQEHPDYLLPSEYFKRQMYGCFWFEDKTAKFTIDAIGDDNILYETDFPHPTSMSPGPASPARLPSEFMQSTLGDLPESTLRKILHDNAARIYHLAG